MKIFKKYINTLNKVVFYKEKIELMRNNNTTKPKELKIVIDRYNKYLDIFNNYASSLPNIYKKQNLDTFKKIDDYSVVQTKKEISTSLKKLEKHSVIEENFIQFIEKLNPNKINICVASIENDFEVLPIIKDPNNKHVEASFVMYLYKNSQTIDDFYKECKSMNLKSEDFNYLLLTMYNMVKEPNSISYIIDTEKRLEGIENILFIQNENNTFISNNSVLNDFIENSKKVMNIFVLIMVISLKLLMIQLLKNLKQK